MGKAVTGKRKGKRKTWFEVSSYDQIIADELRKEGINISLPKKTSDKYYRFFKVYPSDGFTLQEIVDNLKETYKKKS